MIEFEGNEFATIDEIAKINGKKTSEMWDRHRLSEPLRKFVNIGCKVVFVKDDKSIDGYAVMPSLYYDGIVFVLDRNAMLNGKAMDLKPYYHINDYRGKRNTMVRNIERRVPNRVSVPTERKMDDWAEWCREYIKALKTAIDENADRRTANLERLRKLDGVREIERDRRFEVKRNGLILVMKIDETGKVWNEDMKIDLERCWDNFEDCKALL